MTIVSHPQTYTDLLSARAMRNERLELIEGEIVVTPSPSPMHQLLVHRLAVLLDRAVVEASLGIVLESPLDVFLTPENVFQPDLIVLLHDRLRSFGSDKLEGAPSLAVEIVSPSTGTYDRVTKRDLYARYGVPEYWLVDPDARTLTVYSDPREERYRSETVASDLAVSATIPGLSVDLKTLFAAVPGS